MFDLPVPPRNECTATMVAMNGLPYAICVLPATPRRSSLAGSPVGFTPSITSQSGCPFSKCARSLAEVAKVVGLGDLGNLTGLGTR